ncbi:MAG TPA: hypothetical protein ACQGQI_11405 [Xylella sp.]
MRDSQKIRVAVSGIMEKLLSTQKELSMHYKHHMECVKALEEAEKALKEKGKYELFEIHKNQFAYRVKKETGEPDHYVCQGCFDKGIKSVLQGADIENCTVLSYGCPNCGCRLQIPKNDSSTYQAPHWMDYTTDY